jgi:hypothetical protein
LNESEVNYVRQTEIHTVKPSVPDHGSFGEKIAIEKVKRYKSPGIHQIPAVIINISLL